ncbi:DUF58 domain-containing protein [Micromonospora sagamiensis]|uniref:Uncharacterized protein (DUF58 family) n=1 Tax=Micromonospora sagamiensis TaxID=47875 RepID=A0A562W9L6_9ACTN|nr:DUF58 domain-containing protein [Micromonospora sagamiensis]TWJ26657.1 uncharacterized protein (DUF58 family) [Micromonospora sagamiensis]BCL14457.1 hypothetical protein GCM10017556_21960 [Micromonospora sagamiensis]
MRRLTVTGTGIGVAAGAVVAYATGVALGYQLLVVLAVGGLAMLAAATVAVAIRPSVTLARAVRPDRVTVGETVEGRLDVYNTSRWPAPGFTALDLVGDEKVPLTVRALAGRGRRTVHFTVRADRRGRLRLGPLTVERRDPLGLLAWRQRQTADGVLWVHPRLHQMRPLPVGVVLDYEGRTTDNARLGTVTFSSLREYVPGDDPRQIHWRSTARTGVLTVREHIDTTEPTTTVVLDTHPSSFDAGAFEEAVEFAASVVRAVEHIGRPVVLHILGERPADVAAAGATGSLDRLALATRDDSAALVETLNRMAAGGALVAVTGALGPAAMARLTEQRRRFSPVVVTVIDPAADTSGIRRWPGMAMLTARSAAEATAAWHRMINGDVG